MSSHAARSRVARRPTRARIRRRRLAAIAVAVAVGALCAAIVTGLGPDAVRELAALPLRHDDIIRQQAADKDLDPALIAAVIYEESRFRDQTSHAGARGLMQITPQTADYIAEKSGGIAFEQGDLASPQINIAYGAWYLQYLEEKYEGEELAAVAAYNAGEGTVDEWVSTAGGLDVFDEGDIAFPETREYVDGVMDHRAAYRKHYDDELGY
jgi:soluble lytic murein transglycosylase